MVRPRIALLEVDVQKDFCPGGLLAVPKGDLVVEPLNRMSAHARKAGWLLFASKCRHPGVTSHFAKYGGKWPEHCVDGTPGAEFHPALDLTGAVIIEKGTKKDEDAYSAFDGHGPDGSPLLAILRANGVGTLVIGGLETRNCVRATAMSALHYVFRVCVLSDACRALDDADGDAALDEMRRAGAIITTTTEAMNGNV